MGARKLLEPYTSYHVSSNNEQATQQEYYSNQTSYESYGDLQATQTSQKKYISPEVSNKNVQTLDIKFCLPSENFQVVEGFSYTSVQPKKKEPLAILQTIQEDISNGNSQALEEISSHKNVQGSFHRNVQTQKKKLLTTLQAIEEDIFNENSQVVEEEYSHENVPAVQTKKPFTIYQPIQEDISNKNPRVLEEGSSHENVKDMKEEFSHRDVQTMQTKKALMTLQAIQEERGNSSLEKIQMASKESSQENNQSEEERSSQRNVETMDEGSSCRNNQSAQKIQSSCENVQVAQKNFTHRDVQDVEEGSSSHMNNEVAEEEFSQENRCCTWIKKISVEPTMWLYMMAFMFTSVVEQAFFVHKACRVDHGYSEEICLHLNDYKDIKTEVQLQKHDVNIEKKCLLIQITEDKTVSEFQQWYNIAGHVIPIILALFFGNWSDRRGRKLPLVIGLIGKFIYSVMIVVNTLMEGWNLNMVTYTAVIPMGILGGDVIIFGSCFAYLTDICSLQERTMRITILDIIYLSTMPTGIALGSYIFNVVNSSYTIMFVINACLLMLAIVYSLVRLKWQTSSEQQSLVGVNILKDFFDIDHVKETINMMIKWRPNNGRACLMLVMLSMCLYTFQREERSMSFLYTQLIFNWDVTKFSYFRTFQSSFYVAAMLCAMPLMKYLKLKDTVITIIGAISHAAGRVMFIVARTGQIFYGGAVIAALGPVVAPALRSMASKYVSVEERGKVFAILSVFDNAVPLISSVLYSQVYNLTIHTVPNAIYWLTFVTQICVLLLTIIISFAPWNIRAIIGWYRDNERLESA